MKTEMGLVDDLLELANERCDDNIDGNVIIRLLLKHGVKLKQGKNFVWKKEGV